jgi:redox-sensitive bicupin YhaK (pirin superfamily)
MWIVRPSHARGTTHLDWLVSRHTFSFGHYLDRNHMGFGPLRVINEDRVTAGAGFPKHPHRNMEILTYVLSGAVEHRDSMGSGSIIRPGELQYMSAGTGVTHSEYNATTTEVTHFYQVWLEPNELNVEPRYQHITIDEAQRRNRWGLLASGKHLEAPIQIRQDASLYSAKLDAGSTLSLAAKGERQYWLQVVDGCINAENIAAERGDGLGLRHSGSITIEAREPGELLLFDLPTSDLG